MKLPVTKQDWDNYLKRDPLTHPQTETEWDEWQRRQDTAAEEPKEANP